MDYAAVWSDRSYTLLQEMSGKATGESVEWGRYQQLLGRISAAKGDATQALEHLQRGKAIFCASRTHLEIGRTAYWCARMWLALAAEEKARVELLEARHIFAQLGAVPDSYGTAKT